VRVLIVSDMEGVCGITRWSQTEADGALYAEGRRLYTEEINAAVRGAAAAGATEIAAMDCHGAGGDSSFNSLLVEDVDERCDVVVQRHWTEYTGMLEDGCDVALFVGMHARAGTPDGVLSHTVLGTEWRDLRFNGTLVGETGINAALCGTWGCPVGMVTGDVATCHEARELLGDAVVTVPVKTGLGRESARHAPVARARRMIEDAARRAVDGRARTTPYDPGRPCTIEVELGAPDDIDGFRHRVGVEITGPRTVSSTAPTWWEAWSQMYHE
jgi:D-amino peptidase